jgi:hypothetical protein
VLGLLLWEEHNNNGGVTVDEAAAVFSSDITPRVKNEFAKRLGGQWSLNLPPLNGWFDVIATVRNRVAHAGFQPDKHQAADALDALLALESFVGDRLAARWNTYPRAAWLFLGDQGFERRGRYRRARLWLDEHEDNAMTSWLRQYSQWRELVNSSVTRRRRAG